MAKRSKSVSERQSDSRRFTSPKFQQFLSTLNRVLLPAICLLLPTHLANAKELSFTNDVLPILQRNCLACHNESEYEGELVLESMELLLDGGDSGPAVIPGKAEESLLYQLAAHSEEPVMPPEDNDVGAKRLTDEQLEILRKWIDAGAKDELSEEPDRPEIQWRPIPDEHASVVAVEVSPDGRWLVAGRGNQLRVYSVTEKKLQQKLVDQDIVESHPESAHLDTVQSIAWSPDQKWIASGGFRVVKIWRQQASEIGEPQKEAKGKDRTLKIDMSNPTLAKLVDAEQKEIATINSHIIRDERVAELTYQQGLLDQRLGVLNADVETARKRKTDAEKDVEKATDEIKKAEEQVPKKEGLEKKAKESFDTHQQKVADKEKRIVELDEKIEELGEQIAAAEADVRSKLDEEKKAAKQEKNKLNGELKNDRKQRDKLKGDFEKAQTATADAKKSVERSKNAKTRLEKTVTDKAADIDVASKISAEQKVIVDGKKTELEEAKKAEPSPWKHVAFKNGIFTLTNEAGQSASYAADGKLLSVEQGNMGEWQLVKTLGGSDEDLFADRITSLAFRPDGKLLAIGGGEPSRSGEVQLWSTEDWSQQSSVEDIHSDVVYDLQFAPIGPQLVSCGSDRMMKLIDSDAAKHVRTFEGHTGHVLGVTWRADGRTLATAGADKVVKVWDAKEGGQKKTIKGFKSEITAVRFLGLENRMVFATGRGDVHSRDSAGNGKPGFGKLTDYVHRISSSRDGKIVAAAGTDRTVRVWSSDGKQVAEFK